MGWEWEDRCWKTRVKKIEVLGGGQKKTIEQNRQDCPSPGSFENGGRSPQSETGNLLSIT